MSGGLSQLVVSGPLLLAMPVAAAAGAVTFLSPCVLPLVPGYLSYVTGMSGESTAPVAGPADDELVSAGTAAAMTAEGADPAAATVRLTGGARPGSAAAGAPRPHAAAPHGAAPPVGASSGHPAAGTPPASRRARPLAGALLFVLGFSALFAVYGGALGGLSLLLRDHRAVLTQVLGGLVIVMGLVFIGAFDRFTIAGRIVRPSFRPRAGLASAPLLGVLFGLSWSPCVGPTLAAVLTLSLTTGDAARGALLAFVYALGLGVPFLVVAAAFQRGVRMFGFARRHARMITRIGGAMLIVVGLLEVTGAWGAAIAWLQVHWTNGYAAPF